MRRLVLLVLWLSGCALQPAPPPLPASDPGPTAWREQLAQFEHWTLQGKVAVRAAEHNNAANLSWTQEGDAYHLFMAGPFGQGATDIKGDPQQLILSQSGVDPITTRWPEQLLQQQLGWSFPPHQLAWWVRGLAAPDSPHLAQRDEQDRLQQLTQSGWTIRYLRYAPFEAGPELPAKLTLSRGEALKLTLVVKAWQPLPFSGATSTPSD